MDEAFRWVGWLLIGCNVGFALGWYMSKRFKGDLEAFIHWLEDL